ncbi:MAG: hypothetical protein OER22_05930 [Gammaproteobacteria bacterium]|nr:hypothetical protein [Gammaproteobacteria bacterium]MDH3552137.1 hypothetical protein [Gammaproteobacteria bacterium]
MTATIVLKVGFVTLCLGLFGCERPVSFAADIQPLLSESCGNCHDRTGEGSVASGFSINNYDEVMKGTELGPVVIPGSSESSNLYRVIAAKTAPEIRMPPHHQQSWAEGRGHPLTAKQVEIIKRWIDEGAKDN